MTDQERIAVANAKYERCMHGVQSAVMFEIETGKKSGTNEKHLRVGINSCLVDSSALARLLLAKGVFTEVEYAEALADAAEAERARYNQLHAPIKFGL